MRVYHYISERYGLEAISRQRLKIARWKDLNDPFELRALDVTDRNLRNAIRAMASHAHETTGIICFSKNWRNPVQWAHYAAKHTGLCLGFDISDELLAKVEYSPKRIHPDVLLDIINRHDEEGLMRLTFTKYSHWNYEEEMRVLCTLDQPEGGLYFQDFGNDFVLREIIVGANNRTLKRRTIVQSIMQCADPIDIFRARPAFGSFRMVRQLSARLERL